MRRITLLLILALGTVVFAAGDARPVQRFGLFVGANQGLADQPRLRWALADAQKMASIMVEAGGIDRQNATVLGQPSGSELLAAISSMRSRFLGVKAGGQKAEFYFYYSGHSDERGLLLAGDRVLYSDLRKAITSTEAEVNVAILDSCDSGAFTRTKGGARVQPFLTDLSSETTGYAFLTSSSVSEASQESDQLGGSFFTYYFINGLRGAADTGGTKRVTLNQAYQYAFRETLARTEGTIAGAQHASYDFQLKGSGDLVIVDLTNHRSSVLLEQTLSGRFYIRDQSGTLVSELQKDGGQPLAIAIPGGNYTIRYREGASVYLAKVTVTDDSPALVTKELFTAEAAQANRLRGGDDARATNIFDVQAIPGFSSPPGTDTVVALGVLASQVESVRGVQAASIVSVADEVRGSQMAGVVTIAGPVDGAQLSGVYAQAGDLKGIQSAGVVSVAQDVRGVQSSGVINVARDVDGAQLGVFNTAKTIRGVQIGVFNYAEDVDGVSLAVVSWIKEGIHEITGGYDTGANGTFVRWTGGSKMFWTSLELGFRHEPSSGDSSNALWLGSGLGLRWQGDPWALDVGAGTRWLGSLGFGKTQILGGFTVDSNHLEMIPYVDADFRCNLFSRFVLWAGPRVEWVDSRLVELSLYEPNRASWRLAEFLPGTSSLYLGLSAGLTFKF